MLKRRYPGVSPFTSEQIRIFFGRDNDIKKLYKLISMRNQVLLYSKSGIGKTSLLNAGVLPKLEAKFTLINIRFFAYDNKNFVSPVEKTLSSLQTTIEQGNNSFLDDLVEKTNYKKTLWYYFKQLQFSGKQKFILVFDQFEELFSYPGEFINQFKEELHELTNIDIPNEIKQKIAENDEFDDELTDILYEDLDIKTVFAIRSDRLSLLNQLTNKIPDIQETFYELKPLDTEQTKSAIVQPASDIAEFETKPFEFSKNAINKVISALTDKGKQNVETTQLQIVCQRIEDIAQDKNNSSLNKELVNITEQDLPEFKDIFFNFYNDAVVNASEKDEVAKHFESAKQLNIIRKFIEDQLIRNNQRISLDAIICADYVSKDILKKLVNTHLLRAERNSTGGFSYELSHDTLVEPILISRKERIEKEEEARAEAERQEELRIAKEKAKKERIEREKERKRQRQIIFIVSIAAVVAIAFGIFGFVNMRKAQESEQKTKDLTTKGYLRDARAYIDKEEYNNAMQKYLYLKDTLNSNTEDVQKGIAECNHLDSISKIFYKNTDIADSLVKTGSIANYVKADSLFTYSENLNYKPGADKLSSKINANKIRIKNIVDENIEIANKYISAGVIMHADARNILIETLKLDPDNTEAKSLLKKIGQ